MIVIEAIAYTFLFIAVLIGIPTVIVYIGDYIQTFSSVHDSFEALLLA